MRGKQAPRPDDGKLRELILHISRCCEGDETYGATKLNKLLFFSDFLAYQRYGKAITGQEYQALPQGPCPRKLKPVRAALERSGALAIQKRQAGPYVQERPVSLREADLSRFTAREIALVDELIQRFWAKTATEISGESHTFIGWQLAERGETIPYSVALVTKPELTAEQERRGLALEPLALECLSRHAR
jgi:hypothetical protein